MIYIALYNSLPCDHSTGQSENRFWQAYDPLSILYWYIYDSMLDPYINQPLLLIKISVIIRCNDAYDNGKFLHEHINCFDSDLCYYGICGIAIL